MPESIKQLNTEEQARVLFLERQLEQVKAERDYARETARRDCGYLLKQEVQLRDELNKVKKECEYYTSKSEEKLVEKHEHRSDSN